LFGIFISRRQEDSEDSTRAIYENDSEYSVALVKNPRLTGLQGSIDVEIDDNWEGFTAESDSLTLDFRVTAREHRFQFTNKDTDTECSGTSA